MSLFVVLTPQLLGTSSLMGLASGRISQTTVWLHGLCVLLIQFPQIPSNLTSLQPDPYLVFAKLPSVRSAMLCFVQFVSLRSFKFRLGYGLTVKGFWIGTC